ncbi:hypothetical protein BDV93DRAFT_528211 [Ceratobasidium sp. AG-I]|nr:hypothetical protein BDV93DRAFT_528211 [Ceratobasidium sp. AG-I]
MKLLERQHSRSRRVIQSDYGVLCFRLLVVCVQVAVLVEAQELQDYMRELSQNKPSPALRLNRVVASALYAQMVAANKGYIAKTPVPLITVPGFLAENAKRALDYIHFERDRFLTTRISKSKEWNGWLALFYVLWLRLAHEGPSMDTDVALVLQEVICRFGVVRLKTRDEESMLDLMALGLTLNLSNYGIDEPLQLFVDGDDKHQANDAYVLRLTSSIPLLNFSLALFDWGVYSSNSSRPGAMLAFSRATYVRLWAALDIAKERRPLRSEGITAVVKYFDHQVKYSR